MPDEPQPKPPAPRRAIGLKYEQGDQAPQVVASGRGLIAERIIEEAIKAGVPVREDAALAQALATLELEQLIPGDLYEVVAEALAWAYRLEVEQRSKI